MANNEKKFTEGDLVCLASNPDVPMTVEKVDPIANEITVVWLDATNKRQAAVFRTQALQFFVETPA